MSGFGIGLGIGLTGRGTGLPPYYSELEAFYYKSTLGQIVDKFGGESITVADEVLQLPSSPAVLQLDDEDYWKDDIINLSGVSFPVMEAPLEFFHSDNLAKYATLKTHNTLFFRDIINSDYSKNLPILCYATERTPEQVTKIVKWLDWVMVWLSNEGDYQVSTDDVIIKNKA